MAAHPDDTYFFEDGSVVLLAGETLFKVHYTRLIELSPAFKHLVETISAQVDGEPALIVEGVSAAQLKSFLWAIYASPEDVEDFFESSNSVEMCMRLVNIAAVAQQYACTRRAAWALRKLHAAWGALKDPVPAYLVQGLLSVHTTQTIPLPAHIHQILLRDIELGRPGVIGGIIYSGPRSAPRDLLGAAYYSALLLGSNGWEESLALSSEHHNVLYRGYHNVAEHWRGMEGFPPPLAHACAYDEEQRCDRAWRRAWTLCVASDTVRDPERATADILGRLSAARTAVQAACNGRVTIAGQEVEVEIKGRMKEKCVERAQEAVERAIEFVKSQLCNFFLPTARGEAVVVSPILSELTASSSRTAASSRTMSAFASGRTGRVARAMLVPR
ncbi:hypothetical protein EXIGLDRAFT_734918 [Exidia glandulosa HHB12029]|uniref:BTB domain-containing protein n=1 Tax=Exidia glandulosa HHB12029 TaxID=1314781 RepID=A0A165K2X9_EXIGL|nr:hypothetical protein EXIGLDRAFT_734918 [Exidia glandulosa HHB12029]